MLRHERQTVAKELATARHHSRAVGPGTNNAPRTQKTDSSQMDPTIFQLFDEEDVGGMRPDTLSQPKRGCSHASKNGSATTDRCSLLSRRCWLDAAFFQDLDAKKRKEREKEKEEKSTRKKTKKRGVVPRTVGGNAEIVHS